MGKLSKLWAPGRVCLPWELFCLLGAGHLNNLSNFFFSISMFPKLINKENDIQTYLLHWDLLTHLYTQLQPLQESTIPHQNLCSLRITHPFALIYKVLKFVTQKTTYWWTSFVLITSPFVPTLCPNYTVLFWLHCKMEIFMFLHIYCVSQLFKIFPSLCLDSLEIRCYTAFWCSCFLGLIIVHCIFFS